jgi:hypothetical protein
MVSADALSALDAVGRLRSDAVVLDIQLPTLTASSRPPVGSGQVPLLRLLLLVIAACQLLDWPT